MLIVTTIYCSKPEPHKQSAKGKVVEMSAANLKGSARKLINVYQGTMRSCGVPPTE